MEQPRRAAWIVRDLVRLDEDPAAFELRRAAHAVAGQVRDVERWRDDRDDRECGDRGDGPSPVALARCGQPGTTDMDLHGLTPLDVADAARWSRPAAIGRSRAPTAMAIHPIRAASRPDATTGISVPTTTSTSPTSASAIATWAVRRAGARSGRSSPRSASDRRIRSAQRRPATAAAMTTTMSARRAMIATVPNASSSGVETRSGSMRPLSRAAHRTAVAPRISPRTPDREGDPPQAGAAAVARMPGGGGGSSGWLTAAAGCAGAAGGRWPHGRRHAGGGGGCSAVRSSGGGSPPTAGVAGSAGQCPPCPASTVWRCSAITFSARCDGTSS